MKKLLRIFIPISILSYLFWIISQNWIYVQDKFFSANFLLIFFALLILIITHIGGAYLWLKILRFIGYQIPFNEAFRIFIVSNFGRFIPGIILHYAARVYLAKNIGLGTKKGIFSVFLEAYYSVIGALFISVFALISIMNLVPLFWLLPFFTALIIVVIVSPSKIFFLASKIPILRHHIPLICSFGSFKSHLYIIGISSLLFFLDGLAFYFLSSAFVFNPLIRLIQLSGLFSVAWIVGFLTPIAPGGLGVTDLSFAFLLKSYYSFSLSSFLVVAFRFLLFLSEGVAFLFVIKLFHLNILDAGLKWEKSRNK